ncbi:MAG TPA: PQQ-like beta-propeller repeat protein [Verrucomicrobiales bacterium]|nr:PQQ-like beta-propeller repeat protein [Verrucomicrobiales bacterium]
MKSHVLRLVFPLILIACGSRAAASDWPQFRGPGGQGISDAKDVPLEWSEKKGVAWVSPIAGKAWSSPVIVGGRVYLTTAVEKNPGSQTTDRELRALAIDAATGASIWDVEVFLQKGGPQTRIHKKNTHASPTALVEDGKVYVHFGHDGTACLDADKGTVLWRQTTLTYSPVHGNGGCPILVGDKLVFSSDGKDAPFIVALNKATGEVVWKTDRAVDVKRHFSFSTPLLITVDGQEQIISPASGAVIAYNPADGKEIWRFRYGEGYSVVPRPVFAHGMIYVSSGFDKATLYAVKVGGKGDVTDTHLAWKHEKNVPKESSFLIIDDLLFMNDDSGVGTCLEAKTGEPVWQERLAPGSYSASPLYVGGHILFQSGEGACTVVKPGRKFEKVGENQIGEYGLASMGVTDGALYLRTESKLFKIAKQ